MQKKISMTINATTVLLVLIGSFLMFSGITFMPAVSLLDSSDINMFKFFTVDSNILVGITTLVFLIYEIRLDKGRIKKIPEYIYILKYVGVCSVTLTFVTTLFFLTPQYGFYSLYNNSNLLFHLIIPILSIVSYMLFDKTNKSYFDAIFGIIPMFLYSIYYISNVVIHVQSGGLTSTYDFYGFLGGNIKNIYIVIPVIFIADYLITILLFFVNKRLMKK